MATSKARLWMGVGMVTIGALATAIHAQDAQVVARMHEHLKAVEQVDYAIVRGDLEDAQAAAKAIVDGWSSAMLPDKYGDEMKAAAAAVVSASTLEAAAKATGQVHAACGTCHRGLNKAMATPTSRKLDPAISTRTRMREHAWSIDALAKGLQGPSDVLWRDGANAMKGARVIKVQLKDAQLTKELNEAEEQYRAIGARARDARDQDSRAAIYGDILVTCGHCHSLQGRVFGPAAPTTK